MSGDIVNKHTQNTQLPDVSSFPVEKYYELKFGNRICPFGKAHSLKYASQISLPCRRVSE